MSGIINFQKKVKKTFKKIYKIELSKINKTISEFIKDRGRIIQGECAIKTILGKKKTCVEFYSDDSISDAKELGDKLSNELNKEYGIYAEKRTKYDISIKIDNFGEVVRIRYIPHLYDKIQIVDIDGLYYASPLICHIQILNILTNPLEKIDLWEKYAKYLLAINRYYPLKDSVDERVLGHPVNIKDDSVIFIGEYAYNIYWKIAKENNVEIGEKLENPYMQVLVDDFKSFIKKYKGYRYDIVKGHDDFFKQKYLIKDKKGKVIFDAISIKNMCVPYQKRNDKNIGSFHTVLRYMYIDLAFEEKKENVILIQNLVKMRNDYLKKKKQSGIDTTDPFKIMDTGCLGTLTDEFREFRIQEWTENQKVWKRNWVGV